ncbi:MAG TPA: LapD/MoxY N-terminal periplasmic domain-containing protein, partial [Rhodocyclaceae bacterium]|nr:LapD/MoxY N-terminal periplasmic domain-containing protein [Rhodocyclaceae bacterium]
MSNTLFSRLWARLSFAWRLMLCAALALGIAGFVLLYSTTRGDAAHLAGELDQQLHDELAAQLPALADFVVVGDYGTIEQIFTARVKHPNIHRFTWQSVEGGTVDVADKTGAADAPAWFKGWLAVGAAEESRRLSVGGHDYGALTVAMSPDAGVDRLWQAFLSNAGIL